MWSSSKELKRPRFTAIESKLLIDFIRQTDTAESDAVTHHPDMPKVFVRWKTCTFNDHGPGFQVVSEEMAAANSIWCASVVRYVDPNVGTDSDFGRVRFFFTMELPNGEKLQRMAYIRHFSVAKGGGLAYTTGP